VGRLFAAAVGCLLLLAGSAYADQVTWNDRVGEGGAALDIGSVVARWDGQGRIAVSVRFAGQRVIMPGDRITILFDTDADGATGSGGADHAILFEQQSGGGRAYLGAWNGSDFDTAVPQSTLRWSSEGSGLEVAVHPSQLGSPGHALRFWIVSSLGGAVDRAPDMGAFTLPPGAAPVAAPPPAAAPPAPPVRALTLAEARRSTRALVRRHLGGRARIARLRCRLAATATASCALRVRRRARRWRGSVTVRLLAAGGRRAAFSGIRVDPRCPRRCRRAVRWAH
jgi:hypothetical protein